MNTDLMFSSKTDLWSTPQNLFNSLDTKYHFTLDPCADEQNHKCKKYFTKEQDGLVQSWKGESVFCNPPYGKEIGKWVEKCYLESIYSAKVVVALLPARTDTKWFHNYIYYKASEIKFIKGRLKFGDCKNSAPFPSMIVIYERDD